MKKTLALLILVAACGGKSEPATTPTNTAADTGGESYGGEMYGGETYGGEGMYGGGAYGGYAYGGETYKPMHFDTPALAKAECDRYVQKLEALQKCPKMPPEAVQATKDAADQMKQAWANWDQMPVEQTDATGSACRQGVDALIQGAQAMGCTI